MYVSDIQSNMLVLKNMSFRVYIDFVEGRDVNILSLLFFGHPVYHICDIVQVLCHLKGEWLKREVSKVHLQNGMMGGAHCS